MFGNECAVCQQGHNCNDILNATIDNFEGMEVLRVVSIHRMEYNGVLDVFCACGKTMHTTTMY